jgi:hypothetical protein
VPEDREHCGLVDPRRPLARRHRHATLDGPPLQFAIEGREALLGDFASVCAPDVQLVAGPELLRRDLLGAPPQTVRDVAAIEPNLATGPVDAPNHDVRMRVFRVEVVHRQPFELAIPIALDPHHHAPHVLREVELPCVFRGENDPKLVPLSRAGLFERLDTSRPIGRVGHTLRPILLDPVAFDVPQVQRRCFRTACIHADEVGFDENPPRHRPRSEDAHARASPVSPRPASEATDSGEQDAPKRAAAGVRSTFPCPKMFGQPSMARALRTWLRRAGVTRPQLFARSNINRPIRWHDLRATCGTWLAVQGRSPTEIRDLLGHTKTDMTDRYLRNATAVRGGHFGEVFGPLPERLVGEESLGCLADLSETQDRNLSKLLTNVVELTGIEPVPIYQIDTIRRKST